MSKQRKLSLKEIAKIRLREGIGSLSREDQVRLVEAGGGGFSRKTMLKTIELGFGISKSQRKKK